MTLLHFGKIVLVCAATALATSWATTKAAVPPNQPVLAVTKTAYGNHSFLVLTQDSVVVGFCHDPECSEVGTTGEKAATPTKEMIANI